MTPHNYQDAPAQLPEAAGDRFAYRHFARSGGMPVCDRVREHQTGTGHLDHLGARHRKVVGPRPDDYSQFPYGSS